MYQSDQDPYYMPIDPIVQEIDKTDWSDFSTTSLSDWPQNQFYRTIPKTQQAKYFAYFRKMLQKQQISPRSFLITSYILNIRSSNYYALMLRKKYFLAQTYDPQSFKQEIKFVNCLLNANGKEYQLWTYKKQLFTDFKSYIQNPNQYYISQRQFLQYLLDQDSKNYHVWDYKLWVTLHFNHQQQELQRTAQLLFKKQHSELIEQLKAQQFVVHKVDWHNCYSLWSYRHNLFRINCESLKQQEIQTAYRAQIDRVKKLILEEGNLTNQCAWNYLSGIILQNAIQSRQLIEQIFALADQVFSLNKNNRFAAGACLILGEQLQTKYNQSCTRRKQILLDIVEKDKVRELYYQHLLQSQTQSKQ